jgi:uncharacterized membrane protein
MKSKSPWVTFLVLSSISAGIFFRFYQLGLQELWYDELFSTVSAQEPFLSDFFYKWAYCDGNPPAYGLFLWLWIKVFPATEFYVRLPSAIASSLTLILLYFQGKRYVSHQTALIATLLFSFCYGGIYYAQEARSYGFLMLFATITTLLWLHLLKHFQDRNVFLKYSLLYTLSIIILSYTHYFGILLGSILTAWLFFLSLYYQKNLLIILSGVVLWVLSYLPWISKLLFLFSIDKTQWQYEGLNAFSDYFLILLFKSHPISKVVSITLLIAALLIIVFKIKTLLTTKKYHTLLLWERNALYYVSFVSFLIMLVLPFNLRGIDYRHYIVFFPLHFLLLGSLYASVSKKKLWMLFLVFTLSAIAFYFQMSNYYVVHKQQWGTSVQQVLSHYSPHTDVVILGIPQERSTLEYIRRGEIYESFYVRNYDFYQYYFDRYNEKKLPIELKVLRPELEAFTNYIESIKHSDKKEVFILGGHHLKLDEEILQLLQKTASNSYEKSYYSTKLYWFELDQR